MSRATNTVSCNTCCTLNQSLLLVFLFLLGSASFAPRSFSVGLLLEVSAFMLMGSPSIEGFVSNFSLATSFRLLCLFGRSFSVGSESDVSALSDTGSPSWDGFCSATCLSDFSYIMSTNV